MSYTLTAADVSAHTFQEGVDGAALVNDGVEYTGSTMTVFGTFTVGEEAIIDGLVPAAQLAYSKTVKLSEVTIKTKALIAAGFTYSGDIYPLVLDSRSNYIGIQVFGAFPYKIQNQHKTDVLSVADQAAYDLFVAAGMVRYRYIKDGESDLIVSIRDALDIAAVEAITDTRT